MSVLPLAASSDMSTAKGRKGEHPSLPDTAATAPAMLRRYAHFCQRFRISKGNSGVIRALAGAKAWHDAVLPANAPRPVDAPQPNANSITALDVSRNYLGPRGLLAFFGVASSLPSLTAIDASNAQWFVCDERPTAPSGADVVRLVCQMLTLPHVRVEELNLKGNSFTVSSYLWFLELAARSPVLRKIEIDSPFIEAHELAVLEATLAKGASRRASVVDRPPVAAAAAEVSPMPRDDTETAADTSSPDAASSPALITEGSLNVSSMKGKTVVASLLSGIHASAKSHPRDPLAALASLEPGVGGPDTTVDKLARRDDRVHVILGSALSSLKPIEPQLTPPDAEQSERIFAALRVNGVGNHMTKEAMKAVASQCRQAIFKDEAIVLEQGDASDYAFLITKGGAVAHRSEELTMEHPTGALMGDEELTTPSSSEVRRFTVRAKPCLTPVPLPQLITLCAEKRKQSGFFGAKDSTLSVYPTMAAAADDAAADGHAAGGSGGPGRPAKKTVAVAASAVHQHASDDVPAVTEAWLIPRAAYFQHMQRAALEHRRQWRRFLDGLPAPAGVGTLAKQMLSDVVREAAFGLNDVVAAGFPLLTTVFFVVEGKVSVYFQSTEVKRMLRGELFVCFPETDVARTSIISGSKRTVLARVDASMFETLPAHVQLHLAKKAEAYIVEERGNAFA